MNSLSATLKHNLKSISSYLPFSLTMAPSIHPSVDFGIQKGDSNKAGGKLYCHCPNNKVEVTLGSNVAHNHA